MFKPVWNPFSKYADKLEKRIDKVLRKVAFLGVFEAQRKILELMEENLVILDLWLEARFKGYKYLTHGNRKRMHRNTEKIGRIFLEFAEKTKIDNAAVERNLRELGLSMPEMAEDGDKVRFLVAIMLFLRPGERYEYLEGASFGKLLVDIEKNKKMIGDCNQIVTFYTYLFSLKYDVKDLQIKMLPGHVCLHFKGIDVEATAGSFAHYTEYSKILPIVELISTNLLDISDFRDKQIQLHPREFLKAAQLANNLSSERELVTKNLKIAYRNVAISVMKDDDFETALFFLKTAGIDTDEDRKLKASIINNAVIFYAKQKNFRKARYYEEQAGNDELRKYIDEQEGLVYFHNSSWSKAREFFQKAGNQQMVKATYAKEYNEIQSRVSGLRELSIMKSHKGDYKKMLDLAQKMEDSALADNVRNILKQL